MYASLAMQPGTLKRQTAVASSSEEKPIEVAIASARDTVASLAKLRAVGSMHPTTWYVHELLSTVAAAQKLMAIGSTHPGIGKLHMPLSTVAPEW